MADPATALSIANASFGLVIKCAKVAQDLHELAAKFKHAELDILAAVDDCETIRLAWQRIAKWCEHWANPNAEVLARLQQSLKVGDMVMSAMESDLTAFMNQSKPVGIRKRTRLVWNERLLRSHQERVRVQVTTMNLLMTVIQL